MTDKEKIIAEIERLMMKYAFQPNYERRAAYDDIKRFINSLPEEPVGEELEEFAKRQADEFAEREYEVDSYDRGYLSKGYYWGCKDGAKWKDEQLMKNVVLETEVLRDSDGDGVDTPYESWLTLANTEISELPESLGLEEGDKVKVLVIKQEEI